MLTYGDLVRAVEKSVEKFDYKDIGDSSFDVKLGNQFWGIKPYMTINTKGLNREKLKDYLRPRREADSYVLRSGEFLLTQTQEKFHMPRDLTAQYSVRSVMAQVGLEQLNSIWMHPSFEGHLILEFVNLGPAPIEIFAGEPVGQLHFFSCEFDPEPKYGVRKCQNY